MDINDFLGIVFDTTKNNVNRYCTGKIFCSECKDNRNMHIYLWQYKNPHKPPYNIMGTNEYDIIDRRVSQEEALKSIFPSLWIASCMQCDRKHFIILYKTEEDQKLLILSDCLDGIATKNTPEPIRYYLDQAYKARMIGANSACISMYRAALEQILYEQGYTEVMLNKKIKKLENDLKSGNAPKWATTIDIDVFDYIKKLGNGSIHPNDGDISKQSVLDDELVKSIDILFREFLYEIYEKPIKKAKIKNVLSDAADIISG